MAPRCVNATPGDSLFRAAPERTRPKTATHGGWSSRRQVAPEWRCSGRTREGSPTAMTRWPSPTTKQPAGSGAAVRHGGGKGRHAGTVAVRGGRDRAARCRKADEQSKPARAVGRLGLGVGRRDLPDRAPDRPGRELLAHFDDRADIGAGPEPAAVGAASAPPNALPCASSRPMSNLMLVATCPS